MGRWYSWGDGYLGDVIQAPARSLGHRAPQGSSGLGSSQPAINIMLVQQSSMELCRVQKMGGLQLFIRASLKAAGYIKTGLQYQQSSEQWITAFKVMKTCEANQCPEADIQNIIAQFSRNNFLSMFSSRGFIVLDFTGIFSKIYLELLFIFNVRLGYVFHFFKVYLFFI